MEAQRVEGVPAVATLQDILSRLTTACQNKDDQVFRVKLELETLKAEYKHAEEAVRERDDRISLYQKRLQSINAVDKNVSALASSLSTEIERRTRAIQDSAGLSKLLQDMIVAHQDLKKINEEHALARDHQSQQLLTLEGDNCMLTRKVDSLEFELDEMRVAALSSEKRYRHLAHEVSQAQDVVSITKQAEAAKDEECKLLQNKVAALITKNRELFEQIQAFSSRYEDQHQVIEKMNVELRESREAVHIAIRQHHFSEDEVKTLNAVRTELYAKITELEETIRGKDRDIFESGLKLRDQREDYERKLAEANTKLQRAIETQEVLETQHRQAEEERLTIEQQLLQHKQLLQQQLQMPGSSFDREMKTSDTMEYRVRSITDGLSSSSATAAVGIDPELLAEMEKRWSAREALLKADVKTLKQCLSEKEDLVSQLKFNIAELSKHTVDIRSEKLKTVERDMRQRLDEFLIMEEALETACMCPLTLERFRDPMILIPCGHTFSKTPLEDRRAESFDGVKCYTCEKKAAKAIRNEAVECIVLEMDRRKNFVLAMSNFISLLSGTM
ncbi:hypothetical protein SeLEV6574_g04039 [Synchytrium endobioticum]|uniref:Zinc finger RING-type eukaryotic domain-containing protein n=1 Tax=Synchytrium endobioticum TaxID=286115 RepID=A0A507D148_9FUNG|nr:hypothetical protein SeLEV6574_g04039 [Synchytrium endobioticum]